MTDRSKSLTDEQRVGRLEVREAAGAVIAVIVMQVALAAVCIASNWQLWLLPAWAWIATAIPEAILLGVLVLQRHRHREEVQVDDGEQTPSRRLAAIWLVGFITLANALALLALLTLGVKTWLEHRQSLEMERSQEVEEPSTVSHPL